MVPASRSFLISTCALLVFSASYLPEQVHAATAPPPTIVIFSAFDSGFEGPDTIPSGLTIVRLQNQVESRIFCMLCAKDGKPHVALFSPKPLRVVESTASIPEFTGNYHMALLDFEFVVVQTLQKGEHLIYVVNRGLQPHQVSLVQLDQGASAEDVLASYASPDNGPMPGRLMGGMTGLEPGGRGMFSVTLSPGRYAMMCLFPNPASPQSHASKGMVIHFTID